MPPLQMAKSLSTTCVGRLYRGEGRPQDDEGDDKEPPDANLTHIAKLLIDFGAHPDGYEDRSLNRRDPPPPPVVEDDDGKKKKGKKGKKAPAKKGKGKKGDKKGADEAEPPPPPEPAGPLKHSGHRASSETHAALLTPLQHAASVGHHAIVKELLRREARAAVVAETDRWGPAHGRVALWAGFVYGGTSCGSVRDAVHAADVPAPAASTASPPRGARRWQEEGRRQEEEGREEEEGGL